MPSRQIASLLAQPRCANRVLAQRSVSVCSPALLLPHLCADQRLALLFQSLALATKQIAAKIARAGLEGLYGVAEQQGRGSGDVQKTLDVVAVSVRLGDAALAGAELSCVQLATDCLSQHIQAPVTPCCVVLCLAVERRHADGSVGKPRRCGAGQRGGRCGHTLSWWCHNKQQQQQ